MNNTATHRPLGKADIHLHTEYSDGMMTVRELLAYVQVATDLDVIAVTDHDEVTGGLRAREIAEAEGYRFEVIPGVEISTRDGHLLALFIEENIRPYRSLHDTAREVAALGGVCIVPHPMSWLTSSVSERALDREMAHFSPAITALEIENASIAGQVARQKVHRLNRERYHLAETGSSDAHFLPHVATSYTTFPGTTAADLRRALETRMTCAVRAAPYSRISVRLLIAQQRRSMIVMPAKRVRQAMIRPRVEQAAR